MRESAGCSEMVPWWEIYFNELYLRMFKTVLTPERTAGEVAGVITLLDLKPGSRILDLCCGQGRHTVPLSQAGHLLTGLDRSAYLLSQAKLASDAAGTGVEWVQGDMRHLPWQERFDACLSLFSSFGYFEDETENEQVLVEVQRSLKPGGVLFLDVSNRDYCLLRMWPNDWRRVEGAAILEETTFDALTSRFTTTFTWAEGDKWESLTHSVRHYTAPELTGMLQRAGLSPVTYYGDFEGEEFDFYSSRLIVIAEKPLT